MNAIIYINGSSASRHGAVFGCVPLLASSHLKPFVRLVPDLARSEQELSCVGKQLVAEHEPGNSQVAPRFDYKAAPRTEVENDCPKADIRRTAAGKGRQEDGHPVKAAAATHRAEKCTGLCSL